MRRLALITVSLLAGAGIAPAGAQTVCSDGKTFSGTCVKAELGEAVRKQVFVASQPKISYTAPPVLPSEDGSFFTARDYNELRKIYGIGPICVPARGITCP